MRVTIQSDNNLNINIAENNSIVIKSDSGNGNSTITIENDPNNPNDVHVTGSGSVTGNANVKKDTTGADPTALRSNFQSMLHTAIDRVAANGPQQVKTTRPLGDIFTEAAATYGVDRNLLTAIGFHESRFTADATSTKGAMGIMQLMPNTAQALGVVNAYDPYENIMGAAKLIDSLLDRYNGDTTLALAAYAAGGTAVDRAGGVPSDTVQKYVDEMISLATNGVEVPNEATYEKEESKAEVASAVKDQLSRFSDHSSYELFLSEFQKELESDPAIASAAADNNAATGETTDETAAVATDDAQKILMQHANTALQNTIAKLKSETTELPEAAENKETTTEETPAVSESTPAENSEGEGAV